MEDRCICCGEIIPEGRMICLCCEIVHNAQDTAADESRITATQM